jgi:hypothetical protein
MCESIRFFDPFPGEKMRQRMRAVTEDRADSI